MAAVVSWLLGSAIGRWLVGIVIALVVLAGAGWLVYQEGRGDERSVWVEKQARDAEAQRAIEKERFLRSEKSRTDYLGQIAAARAVAARARADADSLRLFLANLDRPVDPGADCASERNERARIARALAGCTALAERVTRIADPAAAEIDALRRDIDNLRGTP